MTETTQAASGERVRERIQDFRRFKETLFGFYKQPECRLVPKVSPHTDGTTRGYRLVLNQSTEKATGSSIGEDEIRLFHDIASIVRPTSTYVVGHAFGLSTFCLATAWPEGKVVAIDNWSEGAHGTFARELSHRIIANHGLKNVTLHTGSSPGDGPAALANFTPGAPLSMFLIDGMHTEEAAQEDFRSARDRLDENSVVMWHSPVAFEACRKELAGALFDQHHVLRTHGPLGLFYNSERHPLLHVYLEDACLFWPEWKRAFRALALHDALPELETVMRSLPFRAFRRARRAIAGTR